MRNSSFTYNRSYIFLLLTILFFLNSCGGGADPDAAGTQGSNLPDRQNPPSYDTWKLLVNPTADDDAISAVATNASQVFVSGTQGAAPVTEARSIGSGALLWRLPVGADYIKANNDYIVTALGKVVSVRRTTDGSAVWSKDVGYTPTILSMNSSNVYTGTTVYWPYPSNQSAWYVLAYNLQSGVQQWQRSSGSAYSAPLGGLKATETAVYGSGSTADGPYTREWRIEKWEQATGVYMWSTRLDDGGASFNSPGDVDSDDDRVYVAGNFGDIDKIINVGAADGQVAWKMGLPGGLNPYKFEASAISMNASGVAVFGWEPYGTKANAFFLSKSDGSATWLFETFTQARFFAGSSDVFFLGGSVPVESQSGKTQWQFEKRELGSGQFSSTSHGDLNE